MEAIHIRDIRGRKLEDMSPNELRAICYKRGVDIPENVRTKKELIELIKNRS